MAVKGFDPKWRDLPDYILGITKGIWEDRGIAPLHHYYGRDMIKRWPRNIVLGAGNVIAETTQATAAMPDLQILGEDVIWSGDDEVEFLSSHRSIEVYAERDPVGRPTGRQIRERVVADYYCIADQITDEWAIFYHGASGRQKGLTPREAAAGEIAAQGGQEHCARPFVPDADRPGPYAGRGNDEERGQRHEDLLRRIEATDFAALPRIYDRAVQLELPGGRTEHGVAEADRFWIALRATFTSASLTVENRIGRAGPPPALPAPPCAGPTGAATTGTAFSARRAARNCSCGASVMRNGARAGSAANTSSSTRCRFGSRYSWRRADHERLSRNHLDQGPLARGGVGHGRGAAPRVRGLGPRPG